MSYVIEGIRIENPAKVWTQLVNTRKRVLFRSERWHPSGWRGEGEEKYGKDNWRMVPTMCLANAIRYVTRGVYERPEEFSRETHEMGVAERFVLAVINKRQTEGRSNPASDSKEYPVSDIPEYNDADSRRFQDILEVLDEAIALIRPLARVEATVIADDVMTKDEKEEIDAQIRKAENDIFQEQFGSWLGDHEKRGWKTFWDELLECEDHDEECKQKALALS